MKKKLIITALFFLINSFLFTEQIDNIILLDTSESMFPYYSGTIDYLIEDIVQEQLQLGDTFHLLSFNDFPEYEIFKTIKGDLELEDILNRILLLQPVGKYTDLVSAYTFLFEYVNKLQLNSIKRIIILTDGIHDPPPESAYPTSANNIDFINKISENMKREGWQVSIIQFPVFDVEKENNNLLEDNSSSNENSGSDNGNNDIGSSISSNNGKSDNDNNLLPLIAESLDEDLISFSDNTEVINHAVTGAPEITFPTHIGTVGASFNVKFPVANHSSTPVLLKLTGIQSNESNLLDKPVTLKVSPGEQIALEVIINLPEGLSEGEKSSRIELIFSDSFRAYPRKGVLNYFYSQDTPGVKKNIDTRFLLYIFLGLILFAALVYILITVFRNIKNYPVQSNTRSDRDITKQSSHRSKVSDTKFDKKMNKPGKPEQFAIEMVVKNQNRQIGHRNIHFLEKGHPRSVGGSGSEYFLIFIIPTGKRIGEVVMEDNTINFIPKDKSFFPDINGEKLTNCLSKKIRVINKDGIESFIVFNKWISPIEKLNRIMHILDKNGVPDFRY
jgi:hypothetical protein